LKKPVYNYGLAVILAGGAFLFRQWFAVQFGSTLTYIFLYPAVLITAMLAGVMPGLLAATIAAALAATWIFPPIGQPWSLSMADLLGLGIFLTMAVFMCLMTGLYHRAQRKVQAFEKEKATRESEERFHTLADNMAQLAWMADEKGRRFWYNQRWCDFTGTSLEEMRDEGWQKVHHPDHVQRVVDKISRCFQFGEIWEDTFPLRGKDGVFRWFLSRAIPIRDGDGRVVRWFGTNTDITDLRNVEEALRQREERLNRAQEIAQLGSWELDLVDNVLTWSDEVYRIFGLQPQEFGATYEAFLEAVHPDDRSAVKEAYSSSLREGRDSYEIEHRVVRKPNGEIRFVHEKCEHFRDKTGRIIRSVGMIHDITERKRAEEKLLASEEKFRSIIENLPLGVHMYELAGDGILRFIGTNPAADRILGIDNRQFIGQKIEEAFPPLVQTEIPDKYRAVATGGGAWYKEESTYRDDRIAGAFEVHCFQFAPGKIVALFQDITSRKQSEEALRLAKEAAEAATRAKGQFLANMSHELRTPMTGILGMIDLALQGELAEEQRGYLEAVGKSAQALLRILNDILGFSRIEAGMIAFVEEPFLLHEAVRGAVELFDIEARRKGLELVLDITPETPQVMAGDEGRVRQILLNLVGNAVKFTEQGRVAIRVAAGEAVGGGRRQVTFTVADTGIGIPEEKRQTLFRSFSQVDDSHTRRFGGTGLGLVISKEVVERMGGTISFTSEAKTGSSFVVTLPLRETVAETPAAAASPAPDLPPAAAEGTKPRLLVAEDDPTIQMVIGMMLRSGGLDFDLADNGEEAVAMWAKGGYDLVLMDVQMPLMDGFEAVRAIRERERTGSGRTPIVALTAHAYLSDRQKCLDAGMDAYVAKPIDFQGLLEVVRELLGGKVKE